MASWIVPDEKTRGAGYLGRQEGGTPIEQAPQPPRVEADPARTTEPLFGSGERGQLLILVLILLALGALLITPGLNVAATGLRGKQVRTEALKEQYCRDAGAEFAMWQLMYGGTAALLDEEGEEANSTVYCNGMEA